MTKEQLNIADMQCWLFRMAQQKWNLTPKSCAELFRKYNFLGYIAECYDLLHLSSYSHALEELEDVARSNGEKI